MPARSLPVSVRVQGEPHGCAHACACCVHPAWLSHLELGGLSGHRAARLSFGIPAQEDPKFACGVTQGHPGWAGGCPWGGRGVSRAGCCRNVAFCPPKMILAF